MIHFYNTETGKKEPFEPLETGHVRMYTCGPTVYHYVHIGNLRTFVFEDLLCRTLRYFGYSVTQVMNITDVDDKTIKGAIQQNTTLDQYVKPYMEAFFEDLKTLAITPATHYPKATDYIPQMIDMIQDLIDKEAAYRGSDGSVYFSIRHFPNYGKLSHLKLDELQSGASDRIATDEYDKDNVSDFVLWKGYDAERDGQIYWDSPFGKGRPGWHLECSAMALNYFPDTLDIHCGAVDNIFPHHENEIAQSEAHTHQLFAKFWMHSEHLIVENKKMSKSLGNFYTLRDLLQKGYTGDQIRYLLLQTHYKTQLNFTFQGLEAAKASLGRLHDFICRLQNHTAAPNGQDVTPHITQAKESFDQALADDLNISKALASLFDFLRGINAMMDQNALKNPQDVLMFLKTLNQILGCLHFEQECVPKEIQELVDRRLQARKEKDWTLSDQLRDQIQQAGYLIEDCPGCTRVKKQ
ncbi:MAG: cysteine--tRNA ligase [Chlamydiia bacterium]|nr:cysteine--tRNA ligase [Chlamydiia bacterium]